MTFGVFDIVFQLDPISVKLGGQGHRLKFTAKVMVRMHVTVGGCATAGDLWRMRLN